MTIAQLLADACLIGFCICVALLIADYRAERRG